MTYTVTLYEHPVTDISFELGGLPPVRAKSWRHVMDGPNATQAICGYPRVVTDVADWPVGAYSDPLAGHCPRCGPA